MYLDNTQLEKLMTIGNLGFNKAAKSLSIMLQRKIELCIPEASMSGVAEVLEFISEPESLQVVIYLKVLGDAPGKAAMFFPLQSAEAIAQILFNNGQPIDLFENELAQSALQEVGNIMVSSWVTEFSDYTGLDLSVSSPAIAIDIAGAILDAILVDDGILDDSVLQISTMLTGSSIVRGQFIFFPDSGSFNKLLGALSI